MAYPRGTAMRCFDCVFWKGIPERDHGICRRYAPRESNWEWPETHKSEGCGDFVRIWYENHELMREKMDKDFAADNPWIFNAVRHVFPLPWKYKQGWSWAWHTYMLIVDSHDFGACYACRDYAPRVISRENMPWASRKRPVRKAKYDYTEIEIGRATLLVKIIREGLLKEMFPTANIPDILRNPIIEEVLE